MSDTPGDEGGTDERLAALAERLVELRDEKRYLEGEIERVGAELAEALGEGARERCGNVEVRVNPGRRGLRITDAAAVPDAYRSSQPDRARLLEHIARTGDVPPGVEPTEGRPIVYVKAVEPPSGND